MADEPAHFGRQQITPAIRHVWLVSTVRESWRKSCSRARISARLRAICLGTQNRKKTSNLLIKLQLDAFPFSFERRTGWIALFACARIRARTRRFYWTLRVYRLISFPLQVIFFPVSTCRNSCSKKIFRRERIVTVHCVTTQVREKR